MRVAVIGGGIVGLAVARELALNDAACEVTVHEKADRLAAHQTGHNSGVVHAGLYYPAGSLKATLCRRGVPMLRELCAEHGLDYLERGKLVVAVDEVELAALQAIEDRARANGVPDLARLDRRGIDDIEPYVRGVAGLHSPHTAVVDYVAVTAAMAADVQAAGGRVLLSSNVIGLRPGGDGVVLSTASGEETYDRVVACAGLGSDAVARLVGAPGDVRIVPFRGEYHRLADRAAALVRGLVYPVPDPRYPFLGVHLTRGVDDVVTAGPNAVPALALEGYRWRDVSPRDLARLAAWPGSYRLAARNWRSGVREIAGSLSRRRYAEAVRRYLPAVTDADLLPAPAGVRAQAVDRRGGLVEDFVLERHGPVLLLRNAPSPAATSSMAIAELVAQRLRTG